MRSNVAVCGAARAVLTLALGMPFWACSHRTDSSPTPSKKSPAPALTRLATGNLSDAYVGGGADATYLGKRFTIFGDVVSSEVDGGVHHVVLGSKLRPINATGIDEGAAAALVVGATIEVDCTVTGAVADIPNIDCGPNGLPRPLSPPP